MRWGVLLLGALLAIAHGVPYTPTDHGIRFACRNYQVELAIASSSSFRLSLAFNGVAAQLPTHMVSPDQKYSSYKVIESGAVLGIQADFGTIEVDTVSSAWTIFDAQGNISASAMLANQTGNNINVVFGKRSSALLYGAGGGLETISSLTTNASIPTVANRRFFTPHFWSTDGYAVLGVAESDFVPAALTNYPAVWASSSNAVVFTFMGARADVYVMPARSMARGTQAYYTLIGRPPVPPRYTFGFLASRWGWLDRSYIHDTLSTFRSGSYPIDAFICDFEWYTPKADYDLPPAGSPTFQDFSYSPITFPDPVDQLREYHNDIHVRFGGIRKPRLGNSILLDMARQRGWLIGNGRNLNYSMPEVREWYGQNIAHFLQEGVDFWWNDEGETQYFTFFDWNTAEHAIASTWLPKKRFFTINRSYSPGMQRLGTCTWTGDTPVSWAALADQGGYLGNWVRLLCIDLIAQMLAGAAYVTCDIGGFDGKVGSYWLMMLGLDDSPELLVRWYQLGVFMSIMRVHSTRIDRPHWPWLYGDRAANVMRAALNLRYQLVPYLYSLAHQFSATGMPYARPLVMDYPDDATASPITTQWLVGDVMAAPVVQNKATHRDVYLPNGTWFAWNSTKTYIGPTHLTVPVQWEDIPIFVRAGSLITLASIMQYTDQLPAGPLHVYVYPGNDAVFTVTEDDGETTAYLGGVVRTIAFKWSDASRTLSWTCTAPLDGHGFVSLVAHAMFPASEKTSAQVALSAGGSIDFS